MLTLVLSLFFTSAETKLDLHVDIVNVAVNDLVTSCCIYVKYYLMKDHFLH